MLPSGLKNSLNQIREISSEIYTKYIPIIDDDTDISKFAEPILNYPVVRNEFLNQLINKIVYTQFIAKRFNNPLKMLEGDKIPVGYAGEEIYVNPVKGRQFNTNDFAGLLQKYEADVKVQYTAVNTDLQYPVTVSRHKLKQAFTSWGNLNSFIDELSGALYNAAYIDEYSLTKSLVSTAYMNNSVQTVVVDAVTDETTGKAFTRVARQYFLDFQAPSSKFNGWALVGGYGRPVTTWTIPEDVVFLIRNDLRSRLDVDVLASAFNMDKADLMGRIIAVDNFDIYSTETGVKVFDGSKILGIMADKSWFRIKEQDMYLDEFYNANNRTWNYYLNVTKMYNYSLFANAIVFCTEKPNIPVQGLTYNQTSPVTIKKGEYESLEITVTPANATGEITYKANNNNVTVEKIDNKNIKVTGSTVGESIITAQSGNVKTTITINVTE